MSAVLPESQSPIQSPGQSPDQGPVQSPRPGLRPLRRLALALSLVAVLAIGAWGAGFAWFVHGALREGSLPSRADGIVVLTGGADRVETGLHLLAEGRAGMLLVSGVAPRAGWGELAQRAGVAGEGLSPRVTLGREATTTVGNAEETAAWVRAHDLHSLIVVTSGYHMARALTEIGRALPDVRLTPVSVLSSSMRDGRDIARLRLLASEYTKFLAADLGLTRLVWTQAGT